MVEHGEPAFDAEAFLTSVGLGRKLVNLSADQLFFAQGASAGSVFYLRSGTAKLTVVSRSGKEATITQLAPGDFIGEESLASFGALHMATATAVSDCTAVKIERDEMLRALREEHPLSEKFMTFLLDRGMRIQSDLVDQLFNSSEKRLARILVLMAGFGQPDQPEMLLPAITEESLAEMIGTQQSTVSFFLSRFRESGFIDYDGRIRVHKTLLNVPLHDRLPGNNASTPEIEDYQGQQD